MPPTPVTAELALSHLLGELYDAFSAADAPGRLPLLDRLRNAYLFQLDTGGGSRDSGGGRRPPGPRPPGRDGAMLARDEIEHVVDWWAAYLHPGDAVLSRLDSARLLPTLAAQQPGDLPGEVLHDIQSAHRVALLVLGLEEAPGTLQGADAPRCLHCHKQRIMFDRHATLGDVWCGNAGWDPDACHDDTRWPSCRDPDTGVITCRRSARSVRHAYRWEHASLHLLAPARPA